MRWNLPVANRTPVLVECDWVFAESTSRPGSGERGTQEAIYAWDVLTVVLRVYVLTKCTGAWCMRPGRRAPCDVSEASLCSPLPVAQSIRSFQGEHVRWNSPPIKTGISRVHCGNRPSVGKQRVCPSLLPSHSLSASFPLSPVHHAASLPCPSHPYCNSSSPLFSPYILQAPFSITYFFFALTFLATHSVNPQARESIFHCLPLSSS